MRSTLGRLWGASIWGRRAIPPAEWKYRHLKRVWLPIYDLVAIWAGLLAFSYGSRLLDRLFDAQLVDFVGLVYALIATVCLFGVAFPRLWAVEIGGKVMLVGLIVGYIAAIALYSRVTPGEPPSWFVVAMLSGLLPMPLFRLGLLGEEEVVRRMKRRWRQEPIT